MEMIAVRGMEDGQLSFSPFFAAPSPPTHTALCPRPDLHTLFQDDNLENMHVLETRRAPIERGRARLKYKMATASLGVASSKNMAWDLDGHGVLELMRVKYIRFFAC